LFKKGRKDYLFSFFNISKFKSKFNIFKILKSNLNLIKKKKKKLLKKKLLETQIGITKNQKNKIRIKYMLKKKNRRVKKKIF